MSQADMQLCSLRGELHKPLLTHTLHTARANDLVVEAARAAAAFTLVAHSSLGDMTRTEPIS